MKKLLKTLTFFSFVIFTLTSCLPKSPTHYEQMPPAADWEAGYAEFLKELEVPADATAEYFNLLFSFTQSPTNRAEFNDAVIVADMVSFEDKNKLISEVYTLVDHKMRGNTTGMTLHDGRERVAEYEVFSSALFTRDYFPSAAEVEAMFPDALERCKHLEDAIIISYSFSVNGHPEGQITIKVAKKGYNPGVLPSEVFYEKSGKFKSMKKN